MDKLLCHITDDYWADDVRQWPPVEFGHVAIRHR